MGSSYVIVLLGDCVAAVPSPGIDDEVTIRVFEGHFMRMIGYAAESQDIMWKKP